VRGQRHAPAALYPRKRHPVPIVQEVGWAPGPVWTSAENLTPHRDSIPDLLNLRILFDTFSASNTERQLTNAVSYKREGRGFDSRWGYWIFHCLNTSGRTVALGSTRPLTDEYQRCVLTIKAAGAWG
jgi:hypothetical protein